MMLKMMQTTITPVEDPEDAGRRQRRRSRWAARPLAEI